jgi:hypothetical protein
MNTEITAVNNEVINSNNTAMNNTYKIDIADRTGHTTLADLDINQAVDSIIENAENNARWVFINGEKFEFDGGKFRTEANVQKLKGKLEAFQDPAVLLTGVLVGGEI